jgi:hypothetical protein
MRVGLTGLITALLLCAACLSPRGETCANGLSCPEGTSCATDPESGDRACIDDGLVIECAGRQEGETCAASGAAGVCRDGVCFSGCGDGIVQPEETCEPGDSPLDCSALGFAGGQTQCEDCRLDTSGCFSLSWTKVQSVPSFAFSDVSLAADGTMAVVGRERSWWRKGGRWAPIDFKETTYPSLDGVHVFDEENLVAVGQNGAVASFRDGLWNVTEFPEGNLLRVWGSSPDDVWAVGGTNLRRLAMHYDGQGWTPVMDEDGLPFHSVAGNATNDVWAATASHVFHYDGTAWTDAGPLPFSTPETIIFSLWVDADGRARATGASDLFTRGDDGWTAQPLPGAPGVGSGGDRGNAIIADVLGGSHHQHLGQWYADLLPSGATVSRVMSSGRTAYASTDQGLYRFDGTLRVRADNAAPQQLQPPFELVSLDNGTVYLRASTGGEPSLWARGNQGWERVDSFPGEKVSDLSADGNTLLVSEQSFRSAIHLYNDGIWTTEAVGENFRAPSIAGDLVAVWLASSQAVGIFDGSGWRQTPVVLAFPPQGTLSSNGLLLISYTDGYGLMKDLADLDTTSLVRFDGGEWREIFSFAPPPTAMWRAPSGAVFVGDDGGTLYRVEGSNVAEFLRFPSRVTKIDGWHESDFLIQLGPRVQYFDGTSVVPMRFSNKTFTDYVVRGPSLWTLERAFNVVETTHLRRFASWTCSDVEVDCFDEVDNDCDGATDSFDDECS